MADAGLRGVTALAHEAAGAPQVGPDVCRAYVHVLCVIKRVPVAMQSGRVHLFGSAPKLFICENTVVQTISVSGV